MANSGTSSNNFIPSTPSSHNPPSTPFAQHPSSQFTPYLYQNPSQFQPQFQSQTSPPFTMSQGDPSYGQYRSPFTFSQPQPQAFSLYYQPYPLTQPQGFQPPNYFQNYLFHGESTQHSQSDENDAYKIYQGLNDGNKFKYYEAYKILAREPRWDNLMDDGLNHAGNIPKNIARRTSDNSSPGNSVGSNNLSEDPDDPPTPQSAGPNSDLDGSLYEGGSRPIGQKCYRKNLAAQKAMDGVAAFGSGIQTMLDELRLEKRQAKEEKERRRS
ncbi:hypothetical protein GIB67_007589 [Kingdonia uniflora]|uniref:No apical meristem-associated C-terminal domain-containing protein n=1 Tax=Kingdonia uniflora TaxID=39325 RepID=A0A7J7N201_9MAGN|nr:hypothetical protein GIB67_007589 [Kingdonia uniflora]